MIAYSNTTLLTSAPMRQVLRFRRRPQSPATLIQNFTYDSKLLPNDPNKLLVHTPRI